MSSKQQQQLLSYYSTSSATLSHYVPASPAVATFAYISRSPAAFLPPPSFSGSCTPHTYLHQLTPISPSPQQNMKIFSWVASKISGKQEASRSSASSSRANVSDGRKDEFSDWPQSLLAIGTFGNKQIEEVAQAHNSEDVQSMQDAIKFTEEEVATIQKEFAMILASKDQADAHSSQNDDQENIAENINEKHRDQLMNKKIITTKAKDSLGKKGGTLKPRSVASLLKLFMGKGGLTSALPEPRNSFPQSRMEKLLKAILQKKIHPQNSSTLVPRRPLDWKLDEKEINECLGDALRDLDDNDGAKWVKTDSDFIVLEM